MMFSLNVQLLILAASLSILAVVFVAPTLYTKSTIATEDFSSMQKLQQLLSNGSLSGCDIENITDVPGTNGVHSVDHILNVRCLE
jgi:hypothetical protein